MQTKATIREQISITPLSQKIIENIDILPNILTGLELGVLAVLEHIRSPLTTKEVRNFYVRMNSDYLIDKLEITDYKKYFHVFNKTGTKKDIEKYNKDLIKFVEKKVTRTELVLWMEKRMKELGINIPSYKTFNRTLLTLERLGLVGRRFNPSDRKRNQLWLLNPNFLIALKENKKS